MYKNVKNNIKKKKELFPLRTYIFVSNSISGKKLRVQMTIENNKLLVTYKTHHSHHVWMLLFTEDQSSR
jgi:hypothetical protein